jgi:hypothetical protein
MLQRGARRSLPGRGRGAGGAALGRDIDLLGEVLDVHGEVRGRVQGAHDARDVVALGAIVVDAQHHLDLRAGGQPG